MKITAKQATALLKNAPKILASIGPKAAIVSAHRARTQLVKTSPVDTGGYKNAWKVLKGGPGRLAAVENTHPIAGVIEKGARPHPVSFEGQAAIKAWVIRKGIVTARLVGPGRGKQGPSRRIAVTKRNVDKYEAAVDSMVFLICRKLAKKGQKGLFIAEKVVPLAEAWFREEVERLLRDEASKVPR